MNFYLYVRHFGEDFWPRTVSLTIVSSLWPARCHVCIFTVAGASGCWAAVSSFAAPRACFAVLLARVVVVSSLFSCSCLRSAGPTVYAGWMHPHDNPESCWVTLFPIDRSPCCLFVAVLTSVPFTSRFAAFPSWTAHSPDRTRSTNILWRTAAIWTNFFFFLVLIPALIPLC